MWWRWKTWRRQNADSARRFDTIALAVLASVTLALIVDSLRR